MKHQNYSTCQVKSSPMKIEVFLVFIISPFLILTRSAAERSEAEVTNPKLTENRFALMTPTPRSAAATVAAELETPPESPKCCLGRC